MVLLLTAALLALPLAAFAGPVLEREFRYPAEHFVTRSSGDTAEVSWPGQLAEVPGRPDLPVVAERLELPSGTRVRSVRVRQARYQRLGSAARVRIVPFAGASGGGPSAAAEAPVVELGTQGSMRGLEVAWLLVRPVRWDRGSGVTERLDRLTLEIELEPKTGETLARERIVPEWEEPGLAGAGTILPKRTALPFKPAQLPSVLGSPVAYVIVTSDALAPEFQRLADWKTQAGVPAVVRTLSTIRQEYPGADDADRIRRFLRDAYARWGTQWALLGGDTDVIPTRVAWTTYFTFGGPINDIPTDLYFSCLDGNWNADGDSLYGEGDINAVTKRDAADLLPEIWVGRAPVSTVAEAARFVDKVFQYSRTPVGDYERQILFFAEVLNPQDWNPGDFVVLDGAALVEECLPYVKSNPSMRYARLYENYLDPAYELGALQETRATVLDSLDAGYNLAIHSGHGFRNVMSVGDANLTNADASGLANGARLTNFYTVNCTSNAIDFPCIGEALMKAAGGAVSNIGSTRLDFPSTGRVYQKEYFRLVFRDSVSAVGEAQGRQKLLYVPNSLTDNSHRWTQMTLLLLGDPEMRIWTGTPRTLAVTKPASTEADDTTLTVSVATGAAPLAGARVTAYKAGDDYASALTDAAGNVTLDFRPDGAGSITLTVTGYDCVPHQSVIPVTAASASLLVEGTPVVDDDNLGGTSGNGDGVLDAGETVDLTVPVRNAGGATSSSVVVTLATTSPVVTLLDADVSYGSISPSVTANGTGKFRFTTSHNAADQTELAFTLSLLDGGGRHFVEPLRLTLRAPELRSHSHVVSEPVGDGDGLPEPGETVSYALAVRNGGSGVARGVTVVLRNHDGLATVTDSTASFGDIPGRAAGTGDAVAFSVTGAAATFELRLSTSQGLLAVQKLDLGWPATPAGLASLGHADDVRLTWAANTEPDLMGYNLYRAPAGAGPYARVNSEPTDRTAYAVDEGLATLTRYYYRVSAVDSSGNESGLSAITSVSTSPPSHTVFPIAMEGNTPSSVAVARLYQPGKMDVIAGAQYLYLWHADGTSPVDADQSSVTSGDFTNQGSYYAAGASVADLDGGPLEIVAPTWNSQSVHVFDLQGQPKPGWPFTASFPIWSLAALGDLDGNGQKEMVFASNGNLIYALRANGTEWRDGDSNPATQGVFKAIGSTCCHYGTPALADLDGNEELDIIYAGSDGMLYAWRPDGSDLPGFPIALSGGSLGSVAIGYLDGGNDTQLDIVATAGSPGDSLYAFKADGGRRPGFPVGLKTSGGYGKHPSPALADLDNNGFLDIVAAGTDGGLYVYDRLGALFPAFASVRFSSLTDAATESSPVVADITGDTFPDIVIGDDNSTLSAFDRNGMLLPGFPIALGGEVKGTPALCDCDGDGLSEIALAGWDGRLYLWDYDFPFSPAGPPPWPQFHHDVMRTGFASPETAVAVPPGGLPTQLRLAPPVPNPARARATLSWEIPPASAGGRLAVDVFDLAGRHVRRLAAGRAEAGRFGASWDLRGRHGERVAAGLYLAVIDVAGERVSRRVVVMP